MRRWRCGNWRWGRRNYGRPAASRLSRRFFSLRFGLGAGFCSFFRVGRALQFLANFYRDIFRDRTRVRLLFRDAVARQKIDDRFGLNFQLAGQFIYTNLVCFAQDFASSGCSASAWADVDSSSGAA